MKLIWKSINIKEWYTKYPDEILFVVHGSETPIEHGIFEGYNELTKEELKKFYESPACYYYNGKKCEKENEDDEECECYLGNEFSSLMVEYLCSIDDDIVDKVIRPMIEGYEN